jgi:Holliday junction resolvase
MSRKQTPENLVKREIRDWLSYKGFFHFPIMQGLGSFAGIPDRIAVKNGVVLFIEAKSKTGKQSDAQLAFEDGLVEHGGHYILARGYEDVERAWEEVKNGQ